MRQFLTCVLFLSVFSFSACAEMIIDFTPGVDFKWNQGCKRYTTRKQCYNKQVCETVCDTVGVANGAAGLGCKQVCRFVPECSDVVICQEYY